MGKTLIWGFALSGVVFSSCWGWIEIIMSKQRQDYLLLQESRRVSQEPFRLSLARQEAQESLIKIPAGAREGSVAINPSMRNWRHPVDSVGYGSSGPIPDDWSSLSGFFRNTAIFSFAAAAILLFLRTNYGIKLRRKFDTGTRNIRDGFSIPPDKE